MSAATLFDVPKDSPSRKEKLKAFCEREHIWTHSGRAGYRKGEGKWMAMILPTNPRGIRFAYSNGYKGDAVSYLMEFCRVIEEAGHIEYGDTESDAVEMLCQNFEIPFKP